MIMIQGGEMWLDIKHIVGVSYPVLNARDSAGNKSDTGPALTGFSH